jgi:hypothetical protein
MYKLFSVELQVYHELGIEKPGEGGGCRLL